MNYHNNNLEQYEEQDGNNYDYNYEDNNYQNNELEEGEEENLGYIQKQNFENEENEENIEE